MQLTMEEMYYRSVLDGVQQEVDDALESLPTLRDSVFRLSKQIPEALISEEELGRELQEDMNVLNDFKNKLAVRVKRQPKPISIGGLETIDRATRNIRDKWEEMEMMLTAEEVLLEEALQEAEKTLLEAEETLKKAQKAWVAAEMDWHAAAFELRDFKESAEKSLSIQQQTEETEAENPLTK
ncbi:hypothetical protein EAE96_008637 [Botrytis aclada]|nr:hypothetical protein EAE96_008637 [Botrytis aclada]